MIFGGKGKAEISGRAGYMYHFFSPVTNDPKKDQFMNFLTVFMTSYFCDVILTALL
jgi:hypothetical protein